MRKVAVGSVVIAGVVLATFLAALLIVEVYGDEETNSVQTPVSARQDNLLPDHPIVFTIHPDILGFINPDGSDFTTREINIGNYQYHTSITAGVDGGLGAVLIGGGGFDNVYDPTPALITSEGIAYICEEFETRSVWAVDETHILLSSAGSIVRVNKTCQIEEVIYDAPSALGEFVIASTGWIAYETSDIPEVGGGARYYVVLLDDQQREVDRIPDAESPAWSRDGEWLAYYRYDVGMFIVHRSGRDAQFITDHSYGGFSWSPDGTQLVYGTGNIYIVDIVRKESRLLYEGGSYPVWRDYPHPPTPSP